MTHNTVPESFLRSKLIETRTNFIDGVGGSNWGGASLEFGARALWDTPAVAKVADGGPLVESSAMVTTKWNIQITEQPTVKLRVWLALHWINVIETLGLAEPLIRVVVTGNNGSVNLLEGWSTAPSDRPLEQYGSAERPMDDLPEWLAEIVEHHTGLVLAGQN